MEQLRIDPEFESIIPPLSEDEFKQLEDNLIRDGKAINPIIVWNDTIIDGHHRYKIIQKHPDITFFIEKIEFSSREEAIIWICKHQIGRRNLNSTQISILIGRRLIATQCTYGAKDGFRGNGKEKVVSPQNADLLPNKEQGRTSHAIAEELGINHATVERDAAFVKGLDIAEQHEPGFTKQVSSRKLKVSKQDVIALGKSDPANIPAMIAEMKKPKVSTQNGNKKNTDIQEIITDLGREKIPVNENDILMTIQGAADTFIDTCSHLLVQFPEIKKNPDLLSKLREVLKEAKEFILTFEREEIQ